jgi:hypothetical protein
MDELDWQGDVLVSMMLQITLVVAFWMSVAVSTVWLVRRLLLAGATRRRALAGNAFEITSDRNPDDIPNKRAPKTLSGTYLVWTGDSWSAVMADAKTFESMETADEHIRAHSNRVMKHG